MAPTTSDCCMEVAADGRRPTFEWRWWRLVLVVGLGAFAVLVIGAASAPAARADAVVAPPDAAAAPPDAAPAPIAGRSGLSCLPRSLLLLLFAVGWIRLSAAWEIFWGRSAGRKRMLSKPR